jgi:hypothetical protein
MKKLFVLAPIAAILAACGSTNVYDKRADSERERHDRAVERSIDKAPKWMSKLPESQNAVYANGSAVSRDFAMADMKAKNIAFSSICMAAGGEVDKSSKVYMNDTESATAENSEVAIRSMCRRVDISGADIVETVRVAENGRFRSYVLVALPTGEANAIMKRKDQLRASKNAAERSDRAFNELDKQ